MSIEPAPPADTAPDLEGLLRPIAGPSRAGAWVRNEPVYRQLVAARQSEDPALPQGVWKRDVKRADWRSVTRLGAEILMTRSKDLQVAVWMVEATVQGQGLAALAPAFTLLRGLCREFWPDLFPQIEAGDPDVRNAPFDWLNEKLPILLHQLPLTRSGSSGEVSLTWTDYINAQRHESIRQNDAATAARAERSGRITLDAFNASAAATSQALLRTTHDSLAKAGAALAELQAELDRLAGRTAPSLTGLANSIQEMRDWAEALLPAVPAPPQPQPAAAELQKDNKERPAPAPAAEMHMTGPITSREEAYRCLTEVAEFLSRTEPHSPVPYLVRRAILWGEMPFHEIMTELARDGSSLGIWLGIVEAADPH